MAGPVEPVSKTLFEEAKLIDRWLQKTREELVIGLGATSLAACQYRLQRDLLSICQLSLLYETPSNVVKMENWDWTGTLAD